MKLKKLKSIRKNLISLIALTVLVFTLSALGVFTWLENMAYDSRMSFSARHYAPSEEIALVLLDQESLDWAKEEFGWGWPWPREAYAKMIDYFNRGNAASFAFDMIYSENSVYGTQDDEKFAESSKNFGRVIQTIFYENDDSEPTLPILPLRDSAALLGNVSSSLDSDRVARRSPVEPSATGEYGLSISSYLVKNGTIDLEKIPRSWKGGMYVRYVDDLSRFAPYSAKQILQSELEIEESEQRFRNEFGMTEASHPELDRSRYRGRFVSESDDDFIPPEQFEGNYVFFGLYAPGLFDICATPVSATYPGVGVHLCQLDTILQESYINDEPIIFTILFIFAAIIGGFLLGASISQAKISSLVIKTLFALLICSAWVAFAFAIFFAGWIVPLSTVIFAFILSYITAIFEGYMTEGHQKRYLKAAFRQYLSPAVIENLIANPEKLNLGGEEREITAYFSDVQGFTSISEKLTPKELTDLLNNYLSAMTDIILAHGGTIDKYEGDAIIAFWGAPTEQADHAKRAVDAALACQQKLRDMQEELTKVTGKPFVQRIGLNTGKAVVGNMGSRSRFDYTMMGDTVNLASRLEGINKQFGTYTMCSKATMESAVKNSCEYAFRPISNIAVVGKKEGVQVFVPMSQYEYENTAEKRQIYDEAYDLFVKGDFAKAKEKFASNEKDAPSAKFVEKCEKLIQNPPENWDGILRATEK
ncbi:MAG: adenylate/guanylate cyclase domain-containing protein [Treponema sp.]|nr:adenylate/guanylate cyclase domain-containing protein [Treponema sp.]